MKIFTLFELQNMEGYSILKNVLNEAELQFYYNTPPEERGNLANRVIIRKPRPNAPTSQNSTFSPQVRPTAHLHIAPTPKPTPSCTQKCTTIQSVNAMAQDFMAKKFIVDGIEYCMNDKGWRFEFCSDKTTFGWCQPRYRKIKMSEWMLKNTHNDMAFWIDTMLHEIAHAIDYMKRGKSDHKWQWKRIARAIGCNAERTGDADYSDNVNSKYTATCSNCGDKSPRHKLTRRMKYNTGACGKCYKKTGKFYKIIYTQNY